MTTFSRWILGIILAIIVVIAAIVWIEHTLISTSTPQAQTYGMSEYTDPTYGFTFWYPTALQIAATTTQDATEDFPGGIAVETVQVGSLGGTSIIVVNSPTATITDEPSNHASPIAQTKYFYDSASTRPLFL